MRKTLAMYASSQISCCILMFIALSANPLAVSARPSFALRKTALKIAKIEPENVRSQVLASSPDGSILMVAINTVDRENVKHTEIYKLDARRLSHFSVEVPDKLEMIHSIAINAAGKVCVIGSMHNSDGSVGSHTIYKVFCHSNFDRGWVPLTSSLNHHSPIGALTFVNDDLLMFSRYRSALASGPESVCVMSLEMSHNLQCSDLPEYLSAPAYFCRISDTKIIGSDYFGVVTEYSLHRAELSVVARSERNGLWFMRNEELTGVVARSAFGELITWDLETESFAKRIDSLVVKWAPFYILGVHNDAYLIIYSKQSNSCIAMTIDTRETQTPAPFSCDLDDEEPLHFIRTGSIVVGVSVSSSGRLTISQVVEEP